uniref:Uncharacterized protein n=1 Tax=Lotus japonicus TaxID=34305 RepID=I3SN44_LOTJA|nr:unknown [Lotus japonicus]
MLLPMVKGRKAIRKFINVCFTEEGSVSIISICSRVQWSTCGTIWWCFSQLI